MIRGPQNIPFAQSSSSEQVPPPYHFPGVTVNSFIWPIDIARVQAYCDTYFNLGTEEERGFTYRPAALWPYATLQFLEYPVMISSNTFPRDIGHEVPYRDRGIISQTEVFVALPVIRYGTNPVTLVTETSLEWILPFIVVGNPMSSVCGREMLGLGKLLANIHTGEGRFPDSFRGSLSLPGWENLHPGTYMEELEFVRVETHPTLPTFRTHESPKMSLSTLFESREASWGIEEVANISNFVADASLGMIPTNMRTVGLKQYRDAADTDRAVYQALVTCRSRYSNMSDFKMYDEADVKIRFNDTGSFNEILQVFLQVGTEPSNQPFDLKPVAGFRFMSDIDFDDMRVIHSLAIDREGGLPPIPAQSDLTATWARPLKGFFGPLQHPMRNAE